MSKGSKHVAYHPSGLVEVWDGETPLCDNLDGHNAYGVSRVVSK